MNNIHECIATIAAGKKLRHRAQSLATCNGDSFAAAASTCNTGPSMVSKAIGRLEGDLGFTLFQRSTRFLRITAAGKPYARTVRNAFQSIGLTPPNALSAGWGDMPRGLATIESMTPDTGWALGDQFTTADVVFGGLLDFSMRFGWMEPSPRVAAYVGRLRARPAYAATHAAFDS
ncbi:MAG: LysR family transcriptional regulator [Pseudomonadales bacterium]|nr:LysR family transcriptional regulator [Pseudomonadales bacterium]